MPSNVLNIDTELPTFREDMSEKEVLTEMVSYISLLVENLRYTLRSLDQSNFNQKALEEISTGAAGSYAEQIQQLANALNSVNNSVNQLTSRMQNVETTVGTQGTAITELQGAVQVDPDTGDISIGSGNVQVEVNGGTVTINQTDVDQMAEDLADLTGAVQVDANGDITIGGTGTQVDINGNVYINGTPQ